MADTRAHAIAEAHLVLFDGPRTLLLLRANTGWMDGHWSVVAGHVDPGESAAAAMCREAREEADIGLAPEHLRLFHVIHRSPGRPGTAPRIGFFFTTDHWTGEIRNAEPHKCDALEWFHADALPDAMVPYVATAIDHGRRGVLYSDFGWPDAGPDARSQA